MMDKISFLVKNQFPDFYKEDGQTFLAFITAYYEYLEQDGKLTNAIRNLQSYRDINTTTEEYLEYFRKELLPSIPTEVLADKRLLAKYIKFFNQSRGTAASYKFLFRVLYNQDVELFYPSESILRVSDGDYRIDRYLVTNFDSNTYRFIGKTVRGNDSGAEALVEDVVRRVINGRDLMQILVSKPKGTFTHLEPIVAIDGSTNHSTIIEAGIRSVTITSPGGRYVPGDVVNIISDKTGKFGKVVVTDVVDLNGSLTFSILDGGSGYTAVGNGTTIQLVGGDGSSPASFQILQDDIVDTFAISLCITSPASNNIFGASAPVIDGVQMSTFAQTPLSCPDFGYPEEGEEVTSGVDFRDHKNAVINIANTKTISVASSISGSTSSANATITQIINSTDGDAWFRVDGYRNFQASETIEIAGESVGTVTEFQGNTIGYHVIEIGNTAGQTIIENDELVGVDSNAFGVVKSVVVETPNGYNGNKTLLVLRVTANNTANLSNQFTTGPMASFLENEGVRKVGSGVVVGNVVFTTSNGIIENIYTSLEDSLLFQATTIGTISQISLPVGGDGYSVAPQVVVRNNDIASLGIGEQYITLQSDDENWGTGNSAIIKLDTNDRIQQSNTTASGDVKGSFGSSIVTTNQYANGTYEMVVRVWQPFGQREPNNIYFANNQHVDLIIFDSSYVMGEEDNRTPVGQGTAKIVSIVDEGILGKNAVFSAGVGANGTITGLRVLDSGFSYQQAEEVTLETPNRPLATSATAKVSLLGVANSEGYYASSRSHISSKQGYLQDNYYYQEYSYEVISGVDIDRYRDVALKLVHGAGQILFGKYRLQSNNLVDVSADTYNTKIRKATGVISIDSGSYDVVGTGSAFLTQYANNGLMLVVNDDGQFYSLPINTVTDNTTANLHVMWSNSSISSASSYYKTGSI